MPSSSLILIGWAQQKPALGGIKVTWCVCCCNPLLHPRTVWPPSPPAEVTPDRRRKGEWWLVWVAVHIHVLIRRSHMFCTQKSGVAALPALSYCKWSNMEDGVSVWVKINRCVHLNASYRCRERKRSEYSSTVWGVVSLGRLRWQTGTPLTPVISPAASYTHSSTVSCHGNKTIGCILFGKMYICSSRRMGLLVARWSNACLTYSFISVYVYVLKYIIYREI